MRIVIDLQGAQTESRFRGIGRYSLAIALAIARKRNSHEVIIALNGIFSDTIEPIRTAFYKILPQDNIRVWQPPGAIAYANPANYVRREAAELIREAFLASLNPDAVLITSLFEGFGDDAAISIGKMPLAPLPVATILYDLIPLISPDENFRSNTIYQQYYAEKLRYLRRSDLLLAISESSRQEAIGALHADPDRICSISGASNSFFRKSAISARAKSALFRKLGLKGSFVLYTGGADDRKNLHRLLEAFATLPIRTRRVHQLLLTGRMPPSAVEALHRAAQEMDLGNDSVIVAPYVDDSTLLALYSTCALFVFPSIHEGFGLPPLEAMACGAPVIAANATSLPEVIGNPDALFDPFSVKSISAKMNMALRDKSFRQSLVTRGQRQAASFTWDACASKAISALETHLPKARRRMHPTVTTQSNSPQGRQTKRVLAIKLDHMGDFLLAIPALKRLRERFPTAQLDVLIGSWNKELAQSTGIFDNIFSLDFFKQKSSMYPDATEAAVQSALGNLGEYDLALDLRRQPDSRFVLARVRASTRIGYQAFDTELDSALQVVLDAERDLPFRTTKMNETSIAQQMLDIIDAIPDHLGGALPHPALTGFARSSQPSVAIFPFAGNNVKEWGEANFKELISQLCNCSKIAHVNVYVTSEDESARLCLAPHPKLCLHVALPLSQLTSSLSANWVSVANNSFGAHLAAYLGVLCLAIYGGHETVAEWAPVFTHAYVIHTDAPCSPCHIAKASDCPYNLRCLNEIRPDLIFHKVEQALSVLCDQETGTRTERLANQLCEFSQATLEKEVITSLSQIDLSSSRVTERAEIARCLAISIPRPANIRQLLIDISELVKGDARTGIQRVTRALLREAIANPPPGFEVHPIYATTDKRGYFYAREFSGRLLGLSGYGNKDFAVEAMPGDLFLGLDLHPLVTQAQEPTLRTWRDRGVQVFFVVYDLLPLSLPEAFPPGVPEAHQKWLETIATFDGALCISRAVADSLYQWLQRRSIHERRPFFVNWFHLGADFGTSLPSYGLPREADEIIATLRSCPTFLMVGTIEPRKAYLQAIQAFDLLWQQGLRVNLVIIGKEGWTSLADDDRRNIPATVDNLQRHPERGNRLFWLNNISDEFLELVYLNSRCLLAASHDEGFGLPIVEATHRNLPILARDIPVFREVAPRDAVFFQDSKNPRVIAEAVKGWLGSNISPTLSALPRLPQKTWKQSSEELMQLLLKHAAGYKVWPSIDTPPNNSFPEAGSAFEGYAANCTAASSPIAHSATSNE